MKHTTLLIIIFSLFISCNKTADTASYIGKYNGSTVYKQTVNGSVVNTGPYIMTLDVTDGSSSNEIKILFGAWLTKATLNGSSFQIQPTFFDNVTPSLRFTITGSGQFNNNKMTIEYIQTFSTANTVVQYNGILDKI
jgi:hypothetical protein